MSRVCSLFFFSGFAALVYELLWFRQLGFVFGNTIYAATTVLTAYMAGLALGAYLFGKQIHRSPNPIRWFAALELGIGLYALVVPFLFQLVQLAYRWLFQNVSDSLLVLTPFRFGLSLLVLILPTMMMGATLPVLAQGLTRRDRRFASRISLLYGVNTLGAVVGLTVTGFILIPTLGLWRANLVGVAANLMIGGAGWLMARGMVLPPPEKTEVFDPATSSSRRLARTLLLASGISGFLALAFEVVWFRGLILIFGSTTYSFCVMLAVFLAGIALGSLVLGWLSDRLERRLDLVMALSFLVIGGWTIYTLYRFNSKAEWLLQQLLDHSFTWESMIRAKVLITLSFLLVPTLCFGFAFAVVAKAVRGAEPTSGRAVAEVYTVNTMGAVLGSLAGGFLLLPLLGIEGSLIALAVVALIVAVILAGRSRQPAWMRIGLVSAAVAVLLGVFVRPPVISRRLLAAGPHFSPWQFAANGEITLWDKVELWHLLLYEEGLTSTVSVSTTREGLYFFSSDGKVQADSGDPSMKLQRLQGHLPMLFHPDPKDVVNIGLGAGVTFGSLGCYPVDHLEVVEIEPSVKKVADLWANRNHDIMRNPKAEISIGDGRNHLFCTPRRYDVITADPSEPVVSGASHLYTVDHSRQAHECLADGGIMGQFLPMYEMSREDFLTIMRSFAEAFPHSALFFTGTDTVMLGFKDGIVFNAETMRARFQIPEVSASLAEIRITRLELIFGMFVADLSELLRTEADGQLNTDDLPVIEYRTPKSALRYKADSNAQVLLDHFTPIPDAYLEGFLAEEKAGIRDSQEALRLTLEALVLRAEQRTDEAFARLLQAETLAPDHSIIRDETVATLLVSADETLGAGHHEQAALQYHEVLERKPDEFRALSQLFQLHMRAGREGPGMQLLDRAQRAYPDAATFHAFRGKVAMLKGQWAEARAHTERALESEPWRNDVREQYADILRALGDTAAADVEEKRVSASKPGASSRSRF